MKTRQAKKLLRSVSFDGASVIVVRADSFKAVDRIAHLGRSLPKLKGMPIIALAPGDSLEAADEERMRRAGWVRA